METVYEFILSDWSTVTEAWEECSYYTLTENNNQFMIETLIRDEFVDGKPTAENISLEVEEHTLDWFDSCGYGRNMLI